MKDTPQSLLEDVKNNLPLLYDVDDAEGNRTLQ